MKMDEKARRQATRITMQSLMSCMEVMLRSLEDRGNIVEAMDLVLFVAETFYIANCGAACRELQELGATYEFLEKQVVRSHGKMLAFTLDQLRKRNPGSDAA